MRKKLAEYVSVGLGDQAIQFITDSMANNIPIHVEYEGSGFREALAYGWSVSKDNNLLLMCYKPDGSIRSYRFDRLLQVMVDDSIINAYNQPQEEQNEVTIEKEHEQPQNHMIPTLPNIDEIIEETENEQVDERELPYDEAIETLENTEETHEIENQLLDDINDMNEDVIDMRNEENVEEENSKETEENSNNNDNDENQEENNEEETEEQEGDSK